MSANSPAFYSQQYATAVELLAQQLTPKIAGLFTPMTAVGKQATVVNQIDTLEAEERTVRYDDIVPADPDHKRPWVYPRHFDRAVLFDDIDAMRMNANPQSAYVQTLVAAMNRKMDDECIRAFFADRSLETNSGGTTTDSFAAGMQVGVSVGGTTSGLNVEKLQNALQILKALDVDLDTEKVYCPITPKQERDLMNEIEVTSSDYTRAAVLDQGSLKRFLGIDFILTNRLLTDGSGYRRIPLFTSKGMTFCTWGGGMRTDVSQRKDKRGMPWQAYVEGHFGSVRRDADRVVEIKCSEA